MRIRHLGKEGLNIQGVEVAGKDKMCAVPGLVWTCRSPLGRAPAEHDPEEHR